MKKNSARLGVVCLVLVLIGFFGLTVEAEAANRYVRAGAAGNGSGSDWTNAYTALPSSLVRGDTYYVADGTYGGYTFDDAVSGSTFITIRKATAADHGTDTGWNSTYGDGAAEFGSVSFATSYYVIDGQTGGGASSWNAGYGIRIRTTSNSTVKLVQFTAVVSNITLRHIDFSYDYNNSLNFPAGSAVAVSQDAIYSTNSASNITISYCRFNRAGRTALLTRGTWSNIVVEHNFFRDCTIGTTADNHGEIWSANHTSASSFKNITFRFNYVKNFTSTGGLIMSGGDGIYIYGNVFQGVVGQANGVIANWSAEQVTKNVYVYNNTFVDTDAMIGFGNTSGWVAQNNLFYSNNRVTFVNTSHSYNYSDVSLSETGVQVKTGNPFVDLAGGDFRLVAGTSAGNTAIGATYNKDMDNNVRGSDGTWDRGAFEFGGTPPKELPAPVLN